LLSTFDRRENFSRGCEFVSRVDLGREPARILLVLDEPCDGNVYGKSAIPIETLVLVPRHVGGELYPNLRSPCHVHMCVPKLNGTWVDGPYDVVDWGIVTPATQSTS
jgi:hypothetical protein